MRLNPLYAGYCTVLAIFAIFTYGFIDLNMKLFTNPLLLHLQAPLSYLVFHMRPATTGIFLLITMCLFYGYVTFLRYPEKCFPTWKKLLRFLFGIYLLLVISFPALTYDLFNYITTAKVAFTHHENPYVVMPVEIPNEPYLAFTRAANKFALYGPVWILMTAIPHVLGGGDLWRTIVAFKLMNAAGLLLFSFIIYRFTKSIKNVIFFSLNPLVLIETLVSGHNDIFMMLFAISGLLLSQKKGFRYKVAGFIALLASILIKGASVVLLPLLFTKKLSRDRLFFIAYCLLLIVFIVIAPLREELYPWYAVWIISVASLLPFARHPRLLEFTIVLSMALELRHLPYMWMGYYGGPGPLLRFAFTVIPVALYLGASGLQYISGKRRS